MLSTLPSTVSILVCSSFVSSSNFSTRCANAVTLGSALVTVVALSPVVSAGVVFATLVLEEDPVAEDVVHFVVAFRHGSDACRGSTVLGPAFSVVLLLRALGLRAFRMSVSSTGVTMMILPFQRKFVVFGPAAAVAHHSSSFPGFDGSLACGIAVQPTAWQASHTSNFFFVKILGGEKL